MGSFLLLETSTAKASRKILPAERRLGRFFLFLFLDNVLDPGIRTGAIVWRITKSKNILIVGDGPPLDPPEFPEVSCVVPR